MKLFIATLSLLGASTAHYTFPGLIHGGVTEADWAYVRQTSNYQSHGPVQDVTSSQLRCYQLQAGSSANTATMEIAAGDTVGFRVDGGIQHPGPLQFYMAKVPQDSSAAAFDGSGNVWFKIYEDGPTFGDEITWPSAGKSEVEVKIPSCLAAGDYLLRVEHIALHSAGSAGGAQFYQACAQLHVTGGGSKTFSGVSIPGAYSANDPGILFQLYWPVPTSYKNPGPAPVSC
ncbi:glycoside hydrolase family 61 protein [Xylariomycetidae sp. FL0641]|nr:glycoside hydrolase family 61 protein [Xylariomycetidae sp. FL0641]